MGVSYRRSDAWLTILLVCAERKGGRTGLKPPKFRARLEMAVALCAGILGILTIFWHDWIEAMTGWDPDQHSGRVEWVVVAGLLVIAIVMGLQARRHWKLAVTALKR